MLPQRMFNQKGLYSVVTTFMLVIIMIGVIMFLILFGVESTQRENEASQAIEDFKETATLKEAIVQCVGELSTANLDSGAAYTCKPEKIKGFKIEKLKFFDCTYKKWEVGRNNECSRKSSFYIDIKEEQICLGRIIICS